MYDVKFINDIIIDCLRFIIIQNSHEKILKVLKNVDIWNCFLSSIIVMVRKKLIRLYYYIN